VKTLRRAVGAGHVKGRFHQNATPTRASVRVGGTALGRISGENALMQQTWERSSPESNRRKNPRKRDAPKIDGRGTSAKRTSVWRGGIWTTGKTGSLSITTPREKKIKGSRDDWKENKDAAGVKSTRKEGGTEDPF